jgi:hypothetical protein
MTEKCKSMTTEKRHAKNTIVSTNISTTTGSEGIFIGIPEETGGKVEVTLRANGDDPFVA